MSQKPDPNHGESLRERLAELLSQTPAAELQKNSRAVAESILAKLNVVNRTEFDAYCEMLSVAVSRLAEMEARLAKLENPQKPAGAAKKTARRSREKTETAGDSGDSGDSGA